MEPESPRPSAPEPSEPVFEEVSIPAEEPPAATWEKAVDEAPASPSWTSSTEEAPSTDFVVESSAVQAAVETPLEEERPAVDFAVPLDPFAPSSTGDSGDFSDVTAYANSQDAVAGPLSYTIHLRGLELADTFEKLREALTDSRFGWDPEEIMGQVRAGALTIKSVNPTKASILINRVKYLPIEIDWRQEYFGGT